jgi:hypothetical protein
LRIFTPWRKEGVLAEFTGLRDNHLVVRDRGNGIVSLEIYGSGGGYHARIDFPWTQVMPGMIMEFIRCWKKKEN